MDSLHIIKKTVVLSPLHVYLRVSLTGLVHWGTAHDTVKCGMYGCALNPQNLYVVYVLYTLE